MGKVLRLTSARLSTETCSRNKQQRCRHGRRCRRRRSAGASDQHGVACHRQVLPSKASWRPARRLSTSQAVGWPCSWTALRLSKRLLLPPRSTSCRQGPGASISSTVGFWAQGQAMQAPMSPA